MSCLLIEVSLFASALLLAQGPPATDSPTVPPLKDVDPEVLRLVIQDQWDLGNDMFGGRQVKKAAPEIWEKNNAERHAAIRKLLAEGRIKTGKDYQFAALIFQHSSTPPEYLLAHALAMTAASKGEPHAKWLAAATLDRYLQSVKQPQVFGTQLQRAADGTWTFEPFDRTVISDSIRTAWCVISIEEQTQRAKQFETGQIFNTGTAECR